MEEKLELILERARKLFMHKGIRNITMDDIARELGMSKKTLYNFVEDKSDLLMKIMQTMVKNDSAYFNRVHEQIENPIDELFENSKYIVEQLKMIHPSIHIELMRYYPEVWKVYNDHKVDFALKTVKANLEKGIRTGYYRQNINPDVLARIYIARMDLCFDSEIFPAPQFSFVEVYNEMLYYHIRGIASLKGNQYLVSKIESINK
ncbi:MAG: TetR/AcrR family transcriptional regulator [Bacteroidia bacterium]|nr:TetR/AcrR family transcriptional regulator [Bacteroidia bacterium]